MINEINIDKNINLYVCKNKSLQAEYISNLVIKIHKTKNIKNFILPGGKTPQLFYKHLAKFDNKLDNISILLSDERLHTGSQLKTNKFYIQKYFKKIIKNENIKYIDLPEDKTFNSSEIYDRFFNKFVTILGIGEDGHIASLFENNLNLKNRLFVFSKEKENNFYRVSISMHMLLKSDEIIFLVNTKRKKKIIETLIQKKYNMNVPYLFLIKKFKKPISIVCDKSSMPNYYD